MPASSPSWSATRHPGAGGKDPARSGYTRGMLNILVGQPRRRFRVRSPDHLVPSAGLYCHSGSGALRVLQGQLGRQRAGHQSWPHGR